MTENERLKKMRLALGLNQRLFSEALGIKQGSYSDVERGKSGLSAIIIKALIVKFRVNPIWLFEGKGAMFIGEKTIPQKLYKELIERTISVSTIDQEGAAVKPRNQSVIDQLTHQQQYIESIKGMLEFLSDDQ